MGDVRRLFDGRFLKPHNLQDPAGKNLARIVGFQTDELKSTFTGETEDVHSIKLAEYDKPLKMHKAMMETIGGLLGTFEDKDWVGRDIYLVAARIRGNDGKMYDVVDVADHVPDPAPREQPKDEARIGGKGADVVLAWFADNNKQLSAFVDAVRKKDMDAWGQLTGRELVDMPRWPFAKYLPTLYAHLPPPERVDTDTGEVRDDDIPF